MKLEKKIGLIGVGNMGTAILDGLLDKKIARAEQVFVFDKLQEKARSYAEKHPGVQLSDSAESLVRESDLILLAVKPQNLKETAQSFQTSLSESKILISILAGTPLTKINEALGKSCKLIRSMPNLGARVAKGITALAGEDQEALELAKNLFLGCGEVVFLKEEHFDTVTAISGSGPAYFFLMMELLVEKAIEEGIPEKEARLLAVQTGVGASLLAEAASESPKKLREMVTSKGGTTEAALKKLSEKNFPEDFKLALQAAIDRGRELSQS